MTTYVGTPQGFMDLVAAGSLDPSVVDLYSHGAIIAGDVDEWVGVPRPPVEDHVPVLLEAPEDKGVEPRWEYSRDSRWSTDPEGAESCWWTLDLLVLKA